MSCANPPIWPRGGEPKERGLISPICSASCDRWVRVVGALDAQKKKEVVQGDIHLGETKFTSVTWKARRTNEEERSTSRSSQVKIEKERSGRTNSFAEKKSQREDRSTKCRSKDPRIHKERQEDQEPLTETAKGGTSELRRKAPLCVGTGPQSGLRRRIEKYRDDIDTFFFELGMGKRRRDGTVVQQQVGEEQARDTEGSTGQENRKTSR